MEKNKVSDRLISHWHSLYLAGVRLSDEAKRELERAGLIELNTPYKPKNEGYNKIRSRKDFSVKTKTETEADTHVDVVVEGVTPAPDPEKKLATSTEEGYLSLNIPPQVEDVVAMAVVTDQMWSHSIRNYSGGLEITKSMWLPYRYSTLEPDADFVKLIDSIIDYGFSHRISNNKYDLYKQQARDWLAENDSITNYTNLESKIAFVRKESRRCSENTLYALNRHLWMKEDTLAGGKRKFDAYDCQAFIFWLIDSGFSALVGKLRQIGFSTSIGGLGEMKARVNKNYFIKFIAENDRKTEEIFNDKIKYALVEAQDWFRPTVYNEAANLLTYIYKKKKGTALGLNSKIMVEPPTPTCINGGSPTLTLIDEIGQINILSEILLEGRPTLFYMDPATHKMRIRRQVVGWGTAGNVDKGGGDFEKEFRACIDMWKARNFDYGIVPIFIDCFSKPGIDKAFYDREQSVYYAKAIRNPAKAEYFKTMFHQTYPTCVDDMFLSSSKTLLPLPEINKHLDRIRTTATKPTHGYFQPLFDETKPMAENSDVPYRIKGAVFVPTEDFSAAATAILFKRPDSLSKNRYYQGLDPISSETGYSNLSSHIWDELEKDVACKISFRDANYKYCYQQTLCMNIYYGNPPQLVENNIGAAYIDYCDIHDYNHTLVRKSELPKYLQSGDSSIGLRKSPKNAKQIVNKLVELLESFADTINDDEFFIQLKTFLEKVSKNGYTSYATSNPVYYRDDDIDSLTYAYICAQIYSKYAPPQQQLQQQLLEPKKKSFDYAYDNNWNIVIGNNKVKRR
jgi:hypothetical protein